MWVIQSEHTYTSPVRTAYFTGFPECNMVVSDDPKYAYKFATMEEACAFYNDPRYANLIPSHYTVEIL